MDRLQQQLVEYVVALPLEQRRVATHVSRERLADDIRRLSGCQRCAFVEHVAYALDPTFSAQLQPNPSADSASNGSSSGSSGGASQAPFSGLMGPRQLMQLLADCSGEDLVGLLQFSWKGQAGTASSAGAAASGGSVELSSSLLAQERLLRKFMVESADVMLELEEELGDCTRHVGYPGPSELTGTAARLATQRAHNLERLAAWGVLRRPSRSHGSAFAGAAPGPAPALEPATAATPAVLRPALATAASAQEPGQGAGQGAGDMGDAEDAALAYAIRLSLQEFPSSAGDTPGAPTPPRARRTPPRPAGRGLVAVSPQAQSAPADAAVGADGAAADTPTRSLHQQAAVPVGLSTWPIAGSPSGPLLPAETLQGLAACGLADPRVTPGSLRQDGGLPAESQPQAQPAPPQPPLTAAEAVAVAAGLQDALVLVDHSAVATLPTGLQERVQHLITQLGQVQQRQGRLAHACQHGVVAAGRKLLLLLLKRMWGALRVHHAVYQPPADATASPSAAVARAASEADAVSSRRLGSAVSPTPAAAALPPAASESPGPFQARQDSPRTPGDAPARRASEPSGGAPLSPAGAAEAAHLPQPEAAAPRDPGAWPELAEVVEGPSLSLRSMFMRQSINDAAARMAAAGSPGQPRTWQARASARQSLSLDGLGSGLPPHIASSRSRSSSASSSSGSETSSGTSSATSPRAGLAAAGSGLPAPAWAGAVPDHGSGFDAARSLSMSLPAGGPGAALRSSLQAGAGLPRALRGAAPLQHRLPAPGASPVAARAPPTPAGAGSAAGATSSADLCCTNAGCQAERTSLQCQLRGLQQQLAACQEVQGQLQGEMSRMLDQLALSRKAQEQGVVAVRRELSMWQGDSALLAGLSPEELTNLGSKVEAALARIRAAQLQAVTEREHMCPVCWETRKGLVFGCGHQTCGACGEQLSLCPICRVPISIRIRVFS